MARVPTAVAAVRQAVRSALRDVAAHHPDGLVLAAVSGGADSLALASASAFVAAELGLRCGVLTVDHQLQEGSAQQAEVVARWARGSGLSPVEVLPVSVGVAGGPEGAARMARYEALDRAADRLGAVAVLLGHTREDQAETVLLGLVRGSGPRSLAGMAPVRGRYLRPLLMVERSTTRAACVASGLVPWRDPHNEDPAFLRVRARRMLPELERALGTGVVAGLARTASLARSDSQALDTIAREALDSAGSGDDGSLDAALLGGLLPAVRTRVLHQAAVKAGVPAGQLAQVHVTAMDALVTSWSGQGAVSLPGGYRCRRRNALLAFEHPQPVSVRHAGRGRVRNAGRRPSAAAGAQRGGEDRMEADPGSWFADDIERVLLTEEQIQDRVGELADEVHRDYADSDLLLVAVLKGAAIFVADLARALHEPVEMDFMAVSSYGSSTSSSGVVRILKDLDAAIAGRHVLLVEDIVDSGLTLSWLLKNLASRGPASIDVVALLRKPDAARVPVDVRYVGFDIPNEFVVGYGLDYGQKYRALPFVGTLKPSVYQQR